MKKLLSIMFCIFFIFCLVSCQDTDTSTEPIASFNTVEELKMALKNNPTLYIDKQVSVKGYANKVLSTIWLFDELPKSNEKWDDRARFEVVITDEVLSVVLEDGDYIEVHGTVKIFSGEIYLDDCNYTMITTQENDKGGDNIVQQLQHIRRNKTR